ncbi:MAG: class I SAM-dependent methyltransferase [Rhodospirillaceae bacterium]
MRHYETYGRHKAYATPQVTDKHIRRLDREIWKPGGYRTNMAVLEIGCGTGLVMAYLHRKGVRSLTGIDQDAALADVVPEPVRGAFEVADAWAFIDKTVANSTTYDRIIMFDVIEHFESEAGWRLL